MNKIVLVDVMREDDRNAGGKARNDIREILENNGFICHVVFNRNYPSVVRGIQSVLSFLLLYMSTDKESIIVLQYPYNLKLCKFFFKVLFRMRVKKKCKIILLIHDIYFLREKLDDSESIIKKFEIQNFNLVDYIIIHNSKMKDILLKNGVITPMSEIELFDYLTDCKFSTNSVSEKTSVAFAGSLVREKSGFLYSWVPDDRLNVVLFGKTDSELPKWYDYRGVAKAEELPGLLNTDYGLVWDGESVSECSGDFGKYLMFNNPHKASLYLSAGIPLIVWDRSALASFVRDNKVGLCISSLEEIADAPKSSSAEYMVLKENSMVLAERVRSGMYTMDALRRLNCF